MVKSALRTSDSKNQLLELINQDEVQSFPLELKTIFKRIESSDLNNQDRIEFIDQLESIDFLNQYISRTKKKDVGHLLPRNVKTLSIAVSDLEQEYYNSVIEFVLHLHEGAPRGFITVMPERMVSSSMIASIQRFRAMREEGGLNMINEDTEDEVSFDFDNLTIELLNNVCLLYTSPSPRD